MSGESLSRAECRNREYFFIWNRIVNNISTVLFVKILKMLRFINCTSTDSQSCKSILELYNQLILPDYNYILYPELEIMQLSWAVRFRINSWIFFKVCTIENTHTYVQIQSWFFRDQRLLKKLWFDDLLEFYDGRPCIWNN